MAFLDTSLNRNVLNGFYRGQVLKHCSNGKCKIWIPGVYTEEAVFHPEVLPDAEQASPLFGGSSNGSGIFTYPRINALVWCFFQNGDQNFPVYFASINGGPEGTRQYSEIGPDGKYEEYGKEHDNIIDNTDKISDAEVHRINVSKGQISFSEDGSIAIAVSKTNPLVSPYNVNLPYSQSNHILNDLSNVIFPEKVTDAQFVSDSPYSYHTNNVVSGLNNYAFGISCNIKSSPDTVYNEITSKIGADCVKGYKTQCRYVYSKQSSEVKALKKKICYYQHDGTYIAAPYLPYMSFGEMFKQLYSSDDEILREYQYVVMQQPGQKLYITRIEGMLLKAGDIIEVTKKVTPSTITKNDVKIVDATSKKCKTFIAAEDCSIDKWDYILSCGYDLYLCSPSQFDKPVLYFDKPLDKGYPAQCPQKIWPGIVDPKVQKYKASIILVEDRRKYSSVQFNKNGTIGRVLSDSYDESYVQDKLSATGDYEYHAFKQDYEDYNKTHDYHKGEAVQANISGYNAMNMGFANDDNKHNGYISCWNYQVRQAVPKDSSKWWHYNDFFEWDQHNGMCCFNCNLSIDDKPEYWQGHIGESTCWPRWKHASPVNPKLREHISCGYYMNMNEGIASWSFGHLSTNANLGDVMSFSRMSADYHGNISVEATQEFDMLLTDVRKSDHPKHCGGDDETWTEAFPTNDLVPGTKATASMVSQPHSSLPGTEPYIHNEWTHVKFTREGELSVHGTKSFELSVSDPYKQYSKSQMRMLADGTISVENTSELNILTMKPPAAASAREAAIKKDCCDWPIEQVESHNVLRTPNPSDWQFTHMRMKNDGLLEVDATDQVDIFAAPWSHVNKSQASRLRSVMKLDGDKGPQQASTLELEPVYIPRSHLKINGTDGTITGDCCNKMHLFSTNGSIDIENQNAAKASEIKIHNAAAGSDKTLQGSGSTTNGIKILNECNSPNGGVVIDNQKSGPVTIHTANGKISITTDAVGSIVLKTSNGSIELTQNGELKINAPGGVHITSPDMSQSGTLTVNGAQTNSSTITASGEITSGSVTLTQHTHPVYDTYTGGGASGPGIG